MRWFMPVGLMVAILAAGASVVGLGNGQPAPTHAQTTFDVDLIVGWNLVCRAEPQRSLTDRPRTNRTDRRLR